MPLIECFYDLEINLILITYKVKQVKQIVDTGFIFYWRKESEFYALWVYSTFNVSLDNLFYLPNNKIKVRKHQEEKSKECGKCSIYYRYKNMTNGHHNPSFSTSDE